MKIAEVEAQIAETLAEVEEQITALRRRHAEKQKTGVTPRELTLLDMTDSNGVPILAPLLTAKATLLAAKANLAIAHTHDA